MRRIILSAATVLFLVQCATVARGPLQRIRLGSRPSGANVQLTGCGAGSDTTATTPAAVYVSRRATECTLTFTHPDYGVRTISLLRIGRALAPNVEGTAAVAGGVAEAAGGIGEAFGEEPGALVLLGGLPFLAGWAIGEGIDALTGANYEHSHSTILVDFTKPVPKVAGRYILVAIDGRELPAATKQTRRCQFRANSGWLSLEERGRWSASIIEQKVCGKKTHQPEGKGGKGIFSITGDRILLESENGAAIAVLQGDRLEMKGNGHNWTLQKQENGNEEP